MKLGKYKDLKSYKNVKIGYGTVDYINFKSIYLKLNSWVVPTENVDFNLLIKKNKLKIKHLIMENKEDFFKNEMIIDFDIKYKGLKNDKKSFMNLEITFFINKNISFKSKELKNKIFSLSNLIIDELSEEKKLFNFYLNKN
jgi:hypothetical protein